MLPPLLRLLLLLTDTTAVQTALPRWSHPPLHNQHTHSRIVCYADLLHQPLFAACYSAFSSPSFTLFMFQWWALIYRWFSCLFNHSPGCQLKLEGTPPTCEKLNQVNLKKKSYLYLSVCSISLLPFLAVPSLILNFFIQQLHFSAGWILSACCRLQNKLLHKSPSSSWKTHLCPA